MFCLFKMQLFWISGPTRVSPKLHLDQFICFGSDHGRDQHTDHSTSSVAMDRIYAMYEVGLLALLVKS